MRPLLLMGLLAVLQSSMLAHAVSVVPDSEREYNGHTYYLLTVSTWTEAEAFAETLGAHLVVIDDAAENACVGDTYVSLLNGADSLWIGLLQAPGGAEPAGGWYWVDGTPLAYTNWNPGEPNNFGGNEGYAEMYPRSSSVWNDNSDWPSSQGVVEVGRGVLFIASPTVGPIPLQVTFTDCSTDNPSSWSWDFGDGGTSAQQNPTHTYTAPGHHTVSLSVVTDVGPGTRTKLRYITALFPDVLTDHWAWRQVIACVDAGIVQGYPSGLYVPTNPVSRAQMAVYIARAIATPTGDAGVPEPAEGTQSFTDVAADHWAYRWIEYAASRNIVQGYPGGGYHPDEVVNRGQMAVYVARAVAGGDDAVPADTDGASFTDVLETGDWGWSYRYVEYCAARGIVQGYADGYHPEREVTRDQMAVYVARAFGLQ